MDAHYARNYRDLYRRHWWWRAREALILSTLADLRPGGGWGRILDIGCGDGLFFDELSRLGHVEGIEPDPASVTAGGPWAHRIHVRPFDESFRPDRLYGLVLLLDVLEHFADPMRYLRSALRLVEPGGTLLLTVPAFRLLWTSHDVLNHHHTRYTRGRVLELLREAGAEVVLARYFYRWAFPVKLAAHFKEIVLPSTPTTPRVPPYWINRFLYGLSRAEQRAVGSWPLPFGSSLLAVARAPNQRQVSEAVPRAASP